MVTASYRTDSRGYTVNGSGLDLGQLRVGLSGHGASDFEEPYADVESTPYGRGEYINLPAGNKRLESLRIETGRFLKELGLSETGTPLEWGSDVATEGDNVAAVRKVTHQIREQLQERAYLEDTIARIKSKDIVVYCQDERSSLFADLIDALELMKATAAERDRYRFIFNKSEEEVRLYDTTRAAAVKAREYFNARVSEAVLRYRLKIKARNEELRELNSKLEGLQSIPFEMFMYCDVSGPKDLTYRMVLGSNSVFYAFYGPADKKVRLYRSIGAMLTAAKRRLGIPVGSNLTLDDDDDF